MLKKIIKNLFNRLFQKKENVVGRIPDDGEIARDKGIQQSIDSANLAVKNWSDIAYGFLLGYANSHKTFMIEDIRAASTGVVPVPPSNRAWGGVAVRAAKNGVIRRRGFQNVKNVKAHKTPATLWEVV